MIPSDMLKKEVGDFVDNDIDSYREKEDISFSKFLRMYLEKDGFFVVEDEHRSPLKYVDTSDLNQIKKIFEEKKEEIDSITLKELEGSISYRDEFITNTQTIKEALIKLREKEQIFFPVIKEKKLIGRISKEILKKKIHKLYGYELD